jgi:hypothetical protein
MPMYQSAALWIRFSTRYPFAVKVAAGKINAVTGDPWSRDLQADPQNYLVLPEQPWLDGFAVRKGVIRQFVAMPLGGEIVELADRKRRRSTAELHEDNRVVHAHKRHRVAEWRRWFLPIRSRRAVELILLQPREADAPALNP